MLFSPKHKGTPLYKLARQGKQVEKPPRPIEIYHIHLCEIALPYLDIQLSCSSGTYVRSIAYDLGEKLGCGAHLAELCRTRSGLFSLDQAVELAELETLSPDAAEQNIHPMSDCLSFLPEIVADTRTAAKIQHGQTLYTADLGPGMKRGQAADTNADKIDKDFYRVSDSAGRLLAVVTRSEDGRTYNYSCVFSE